MSSSPSRMLRCQRRCCIPTARKAILTAQSKQTFNRPCFLSVDAFRNESYLVLSTQHQRRMFASHSSPYDPLARRPNKICDPYGQGGKPLSHEEAQNLLATVDRHWKLVPDNNENDTPPTGLMREFPHPDYITASQFVTKIAAVATVHNHYPCIVVERKLLPKAWQVVTQVKCQTPTLQGLSYNDFYLAMQIDVEVQRPSVKQLVLSEEEAS